VAIGACAGLGVVALLYGVLAYTDWQWLNEHFSGVTDQTRWTPEKIQAKLTNSVLLMVAGALGLATFFIGFFFVRKALDDDRADAVKKWSLIAGITGILPGLVFGGLLELFIWRAHAGESFTMFGLLGAAPAPAPDPSLAHAAPVFDAAAEEAKRKSEYMSLFAGPAPAPAPPAYGYAPAPAYTAAQGYGYAPAPAAYGTAPTTSATDYAYAQAEPAPGPAPAHAAAPDMGQQYVQQPSGAPICSCGRAMEWVAEYSRYYCYTDDKYEGET